MILTDQNFNQEVETNGTLLVDFLAEWCRPCKVLSPILDEISIEYGLPVGRLNVDENPGKTQEYSVQSIPTMVLFVDGQEVQRIIGAMPKHKLLKELSAWL